MPACARVPTFSTLRAARRTSRTTDHAALPPPQSPAAGPAGGFGRWGRGNGLAPADLSASVSVFLIALPLSLGIALATGAPLQAGLVAAAVGGIVAGRFGGAPLQVSGPAAGLTVVTAELIQLYGWRTTCAITVLAGLSQLGLAYARIATTALAVSPAIVHGMLGGIGVTIALAQLHIVLGGTPKSSALTNLAALPEQLAQPHLAALAASILTVAVLILWPRLRVRYARLTRALPGPLAAVLLATGFVVVAGLELPRVDLPSWRSHALPEVPQGPVLGLLAAVLTITLVASVESLLSAVAVDKLVAARTDERGGPPVPRADLDRELRGQGAANVVSGALGGLPVTGVAVRSAANVQAGGVSRHSTIAHGCWVVLAAALLVPALELIPLAALAALVMVIGVQLVNLTHIRTVNRHREAVPYAATVAGVVLLGVLEGVLIGVSVAIVVSLRRLADTRICYSPGPSDGSEPGRVRVRGQLTFMSVPRLCRTLGQVPSGSRVSLELDTAYVDHAAYEALRDWRHAHVAHGGKVEFVEPPKADEAGRTASRLPWKPWCSVDRHAGPDTGHTGPDAALLRGVRDFQRATAPLVRSDLARLARDGQRPRHVFLTCADSRLVTSMITSSGPGDLFTVRNVGNLVPPPGSEHVDHSVGAALEYAVDVLGVDSITVCGHSGCGAMRTLAAGGESGTGADSSLSHWLDHARPSLRRLRVQPPTTAPRLAGTADLEELELLCLTNVVQQVEHLRSHPCVSKRLADGSLRVHGMYFHVGEAQAYVLEQDVVPDQTHFANVDRKAANATEETCQARTAVFVPVRPETVGEHLLATAGH